MYEKDWASLHFHPFLKPCLSVKVQHNELRIIFLPGLYTIPSIGLSISLLSPNLMILDPFRHSVLERQVLESSYIGYQDWRFLYYSFQVSLLRDRKLQLWQAWYSNIKG